MRFKTTLFLVIVLASLVAVIQFYGGREEEGPQGPTQLFPGVNFNSVDRIELALFVRQEAVLERRSSGRWGVVHPFRDDARADEVERILIALEEGVKEEVISRDGSVDFASKGLDPVQMSISFRAASGTHRLDIGTRDPLGAEVFVTVDGGKILYRTGSNILNFMKMNPETLRDSRLFRIDPNVVDGISLVGPEGTVLVAERQRGRWRIVEPIKDDANGGSLQNLLARLGRLEADSVYDESPSAESLTSCGFDDNTWTITLKSGNMERAVVFAPKELGPSAAVFCRRVGGEAVLLTGRSQFNSLPTELDRFRLRQIFPQVREHVQSVTVEGTGGRRLVLKRDKGQYFSIREPFNASADNMSDGDMTPVARFFSSLFSIEAKGFVTDGTEELPADLAPFGLDEPRIRVSVYWEQGVMSRTVTIAFGKGAGELVNATRSDKPRIIYSVERESLDFLEQDPLLLRDRRVFYQEIGDVIRAEFLCGKQSFSMEREGQRKGGFFQNDPDQRFQVFMNEMMRERVVCFEPGESLPGDNRFADSWGTVRYFVEEKGKERYEVLAEFGARAEGGFYGRSSDIPTGVYILPRGFRERFAALFTDL